MPSILKTQDIAVLLDKSPDDINALARKGELRGHKIGKQWRFRNVDVNRYLDKLRMEMMSSGEFAPGGVGK